MDEQDYILDDYQYRTLMAIRDIAENAFCGYPEGHGYEEEQELAKSFAWFVRDFINLFDASKQSADDYIEHLQRIQLLYTQHQ